MEKARWSSNNPSFFLVFSSIGKRASLLFFLLNSSPNSWLGFSQFFFWTGRTKLTRNIDVTVGQNWTGFFFIIIISFYEPLAHQLCCLTNVLDLSTYQTIKWLHFYKKTLRSEFHLSVYKATRHWKSSMLKVACLRVRRASAIENYSMLISINESFSATFMSLWIFSGVNLAKEDSWTGIKSNLLLMLSM